MLGSERAGVTSWAYLYEELLVLRDDQQDGNWTGGIVRNNTLSCDNGHRLKDYLGYPTPQFTGHLTIDSSFSHPDNHSKYNTCPQSVEHCSSRKQQENEQSLPEDHMADFHHLDDAKDIWLAVKARFGGNEESKKMRKSMLKQEFVDFKISESEGLHKGYDRGFTTFWSQDPLEIDEQGSSSYDSRVPAAPTHSAFISAASTNSKWSNADSKGQPSTVNYTTTSSSAAASGNVLENVLHSFNADKSEEPKALVSVDSMLNWSDHESEDMEKGASEVYGMIAGYGDDTIIPTGDTPDGGGIDSVSADGVFVAADNGSDGASVAADVGADSVSVAASDATNAETEFALMGLSTRYNLCPFGYEVFDLSAPSIFDSSLKDAIEKPLSDWFVKPVGMHAVPPPITGTFMPPSNKPDIDDTQFTYGSKSNNSSDTNSVSNDFVSCDNSDKSSDSEPTDFASCVPSVQTSSSTTTESLASASSSVDLKTLHKTDDLGPSNVTQSPSFSFKENVKAPRNLCNRNGYVPALVVGIDQHLSVLGGLIYQMNMDGARRGNTDKTSGRQAHVSSDLGLSCNRRNWHDFVKIKGRGTVLWRLEMAKILEKAQSGLHFKFENKRWLIVDLQFHEQLRNRIGQWASFKTFTNEHNCVACNKGKQHKASYKAITAVSSISEPLQLLHMDLFGPTSIRSIGHKSFSLVVTDDFTRFSWVFFLGSKDETFYILRDFITFVENQLSKQVKAIRTPQQNGVAERKNRTLIEAARTMLADSKLPTMFWSEAVSTACYVLNRGGFINVSHLKPFGCHVTILNTSDHLGKFEGKADEGFLVGYSAHSKAYRVYNLSNKRIEETLNLRYMEDKPNIQGLGHAWYFDLDYLTDSLGYTRFKSNQPAGTQDTNNHAGTYDDSDSESDEQLIVVLSFPSNRFSGPEVNPASDTVECTSDYAEELARLQRQEYEANSAAKDTWNTADTVTLMSVLITVLAHIPHPPSILLGSINQAAGGSAVPSTPSSFMA
ncbi:putative ribonuclease H-like domain-containing protein [Tanacetum coccineum]|uniref:Ribonuclease H-like domain-containing protein n=1 Tax=Tanacetum coccineum TaxID=301880 RepID=A0ABQ5A0D5_9ASTR